MLQQAGEYLVLDNPQTFQLNPVLATKWTPNSDGTEWTFTLRPNVKFHNGKTMTADDVVYTFKQQSNPNGKGNALSVFGGLLTPDGVSKVDDLTVKFSLEAATGSFPYLISTDNYNCIIVPAGTDFGTWEKTFIGTGPFKLTKYTVQGGRDSSPPTRTGGTARSARPGWTGPSMPPSRRRSSPCRAATRT